MLGARRAGEAEFALACAIYGYGQAADRDGALLPGIGIACEPSLPCGYAVEAILSVGQSHVTMCCDLALQDGNGTKRWFASRRGSGSLGSHFGN